MKLIDNGRRQLSKNKLSILSLAGTDTLIIRKQKDSNFFITAPDSIIISKDSLIMLVNFLVTNNFLSPKVIEGIIEESYTK